MCIYHALINTQSTHMIHINLNTVFYTHVQHSPTETIYIRYYMGTCMHTRTHTLWLLQKLGINISCVGVEILWEEEGFQFGFKRWQGWVHILSITFQHLPPNSAGFGYATEGALFISVQLSTDAVGTLWKVWVLIIMTAEAA